MSVDKDLFVERLNTSIKKSCKTISQISREVGISETSISNYRRGVVFPRYDTASELAKCLNVNIHWLFGESDGCDNLTGEESKFLSTLSLLSEREKKCIFDTVNLLSKRRAYSR